MDVSCTKNSLFLDPGSLCAMNKKRHNANDLHLIKRHTLNRLSVICSESLFRQLSLELDKERATPSAVF